MALERYRQKRNFGVTPEPEGKLGRPRVEGLRFVVQKHAATRLHYDFRLELNGVLLSWAVPKGPSLDPNDKRLAMHVEDHPLEYGEFEGVIPAKQYGAGTVMVWDQGTWTPKSDPEEGYAKGRLKFELHGEKLKGGWNLVRSGSSKYGTDKGWLLFKESDDHARLGPQALIVDDRPDSAVSGRSLDEIASAKDRVWHSNRSVADNVKGGAVRTRASRASAKLDKLQGARKLAMPERLDTQLATAVTSPPKGASWVHEIKHDGYRMLARIADGEARLVSRSAKDWTDDFPTIARALARLPVDEAWLDGEIVALDAQGRGSFQALQNALSGASKATLVYYAFDLLYRDGIDLRGVTLLKRKEVLEQLVAEAGTTIRYSEHFAVPGDAFLDNVRKLGLEGMVSKRADEPHRPGRSPAWQKLKCLRRQEMVIGGYTDPEGSRQHFGALLMGVYEQDGRLRYSGKVGTGFTEASLKSVMTKLRPLEQAKSAFYNPPRGAEARRAHWVEPVLVAEVAFTEWTDEGTLRHPTFQGLRTDKPAAEVVREEALVDEDGTPASPPQKARTSPVANAAEGKDAVAGVAISNPDKLLYAESKLSKRDLARYYAAIGEWMLPHLQDRPLTLVRCPNGWDQKCFYQKNADEGVHAALTRVRIDGGDGGESLYMMANSVTALVALLQMGVLEVHPWGSRSPKLGFPDRIIFDLDPDETLAWAEVKQAALLVKTLIENVGLAPFLKTTGGKGLHVVVPIEPTLGWEHVKGFTKAVAELLERTFPDRFTSKLLKISRGGRIFIDYLRNAEGATAVGAYSLRAKSGAPVSTPIGWDELGKDVRYAYFNAGTVPKRLARMKRDPWHGLAAAATSLTPAVLAKVGYRAR